MKTADPCPRCGWKYGFHICVDLSKPCKDEGHIRPTRVMTDEHKAAIGDAQRERWARYYEENARRDERIIDMYNQGGTSMVSIAKELGLAKSTVNKVLNRAARDGLVTLRPSGHTLARGAV